MPKIFIKESARKEIHFPGRNRGIYIHATVECDFRSNCEDKGLKFVL